MTSQKRNPKQDWGYYAVTPRIVRTQYKNLSHTEKWLYVCLKDLCGDKGMCYRTLRVLAQETDLSIGNLSTGIRHLHEAGLIHAEKKRRNNNPTAKEVWHISIVDIWQSNVQYCSKNEHSQEDVQTVNNNVQNLNEPSPQRSENEQQCSNFVDRRKNSEEQQSEERTIEGECVDQPTDSTHPFSLQGETDEHPHGHIPHQLHDLHSHLSDNHSRGTPGNQDRTPVDERPPKGQVAPTSENHGAVSPSSVVKHGGSVPLPHSAVSPTVERPEPPPSSQQEAPTVFREGGRNGRVSVSPGIPTKPAWVTLLDAWDKDYHDGRRSKRDALTEKLARDFTENMGRTYDDVKKIVTHIKTRNLNKGKPITFTMIYDASDCLFPEAPTQNGNTPTASKRSSLPPRVKTRAELKAEAY